MDSFRAPENKELYLTNKKKKKEIELAQFW